MLIDVLNNISLYLDDEVQRRLDTITDMLQNIKDLVIPINKLVQPAGEEVFIFLIIFFLGWI